MNETSYLSPLGKMRLRAENGCLVELRFCEETSAEDSCEVLEQAKKWLDIYFAGERPDFTPSIELVGTEFQKSVWKLLMEIPYGQTATYGELAAKIAKQRGLTKMSAQAVGAAAGKNPILLIVPCHRLIGSDGSLTGFAAGVERKRELLRIEKILLP